MPVRPGLGGDKNAADRAGRNDGHEIAHKLADAKIDRARKKRIDARDPVHLAGLQHIRRLRQRDLDHIDLRRIAAVDRDPLQHHHVKQAADSRNADLLAGKILGPVIPLVGETTSPAADGSGKTLVLAKD